MKNLLKKVYRKYSYKESNTFHLKPFPYWVPNIPEIYRVMKLSKTLSIDGIHKNDEVILCWWNIFRQDEIGMDRYYQFILALELDSV